MTIPDIPTKIEGGRELARTSVSDFSELEPGRFMTGNRMTEVLDIPGEGWPVELPVQEMEHDGPLPPRQYKPEFSLLKVEMPDGVEILVRRWDAKTWLAALAGYTKKPGGPRTVNDVYGGMLSNG